LARRVHSIASEGTTMRISFSLASMVLASGLALAAQDGDRDRLPKTKVIVEEGKEITVTGCIERNPDGGYTITHATGKEGVVGSYILARLDGADDELSGMKDHVGHRVELKGRAADRGEGKLRILTENRRTETRAEVKGDLGGLPYLGVKSARMLASVCP
jgi:hypothetical protein